MLAVSKCDISLIDLFLRHNPNLKQKDFQNRNCLFYAISKEKGDNVDVVQKLIESGVDIHEVDKHGYSALTVAASMNMPYTVELLLKNNIDVNHVESCTGFTFTKATLLYIMQSSMKMFCY